MDTALSSMRGIGGGYGCAGFACQSGDSTTTLLKLGSTRPDWSASGRSCNVMEETMKWTQGGVVASIAATLFALASAPVHADVVNGGFETGTLAGWTQTGDASFSGVDRSPPLSPAMRMSWLEPIG